MKVKSLLFLFFLLLGYNSKGQYANLGTGNLRNQIWWIDWNNFVVSNGAIKTFLTDEILPITTVFT